MSIALYIDICYNKGERWRRCAKNCDAPGKDSMEEKKRSVYRGYTEAQARAAKKYRQSMGEFKVVVSQEKKEEYKAAAAAAGQSLNQFTVDALDEKIERRKKK